MVLPYWKINPEELVKEKKINCKSLPIVSKNLWIDVNKVDTKREDT
ncbi:hypothetical protein [Enterococcus faecalis]|nr:hypothetical protein [Enterococcus faecalis]MEB7954565.1 hypothetical protein [Enterococcus faecalis]MEB7964728.1 hypothetical protein [Enterococcus faecalis]